MVSDFGVLDSRIRHVELARYSGTRVGRLPGGVERLLPRGRTERISLFPAWDAASRADLLDAVLVRLEALGYRPKSSVALGARRAEQVDVGDGALQSYEALLAGSDRGWPALALLMERGNEEGIVLSSDLDGSTLFIDAWGFTALEDEDELFDLIWTATREYH